jgi:hypothetical protein
VHLIGGSTIYNLEQTGLRHPLDQRGPNSVNLGVQKQDNASEWPHTILHACRVRVHASVRNREKNDFSLRPRNPAPRSFEKTTAAKTNKPVKSPFFKVPISPSFALGPNRPGLQRCRRFFKARPLAAQHHTGANQERPSESIY